jgi:DUF971 family protein
MNDAAVMLEVLEVRAPRGARHMEVVFSDGHVAALPHEILRGYCPCAVCQGHQGDIKFVEGGDQELADLEEVGNYALRLVWGDGHSTGLYSYRLLRALCQCSTCAPVEPHAQHYSR